MQFWPSAAFLRLVCLFAVSIGLIGLQPTSLIVFSLALFGWVLLGRRSLLGLILQRIWRMRWFFLAIGLLYGLGGAEHQLDALAWHEGLYRVLILICLVALVSLCLDDQDSADTAAALAQLLRPLRLIRFPVETFSRRLALSLRTVQWMDQEMQQLRRNERIQLLSGLARLCLDAESDRSQDCASEPQFTAATMHDCAMLLSLGAAVLLVRFI